MSINSKSITETLEFQNYLFQAKNKKELSLVITNESKRFINYKTAIVWEKGCKNSIKVIAISGLLTLGNRREKSDYIDNIEYMGSLILSQFGKKNIDISIDEILPKEQRKLQLGNYTHIFYSPFFTHSECTGGAFFLKNRKSDEKEFKNFDNLSEIYNINWKNITENKCKNFFKSSKIFYAVLLAIIIIFSIRIKETSIAPAEIISENPKVITTPIDGVIEKIFVTPGQKINKGDKLFKMSQDDLINMYNVANEQLKISENEYRIESLKGLSDAKSRSDAKILKIKIGEYSLKKSYAKKILGKSIVRSPIDGFVIVNSPESFSGKPVQTGERIMEIARPGKMAVRIWLPVKNIITFKPGARVKVFLDNNPLKSLSAQIDHINFQAEVTPSNIPAFRVIASLSPGQGVQEIGEHGDARIIGDKRVSIFFHLFRRPISFLRQVLGI